MLIERFGLDVCNLLNVYALTEKSQREVVTIAEKTTVKVPVSRYQVSDNWQDHLVFALKYEGVNLFTSVRRYRRDMKKCISLP